jgi:DNA polymerase III subunit epsilon
MPARGVSARPAPPRRPGRTPWRDVRYAALDFETTGLDFRADTVVSFGVVPVERGRAVMRGAVHQLVRPAVPPSPLSQTVHELRPQDLAAAPPLDEARATLADALADRYLLVWFADVEVHFLRAIFGGGERGWRRRTIDVRTLAIAVDGGGPAERDRRGYALAATAERWGVPVANAHEALDDALVTAVLFLTLAPKLTPGVAPSLRRVLRAARA